MSTEFEGDEVSAFAACLPATRLEAPEAYQRGTILTLQVEVRVRSVRLEEDRKGNLSRNHMLALENVSIIGSETPAERRAAAEAAHEAILEAAQQELLRQERLQNPRDPRDLSGSFDEPIGYTLTEEGEKYAGRTVSLEDVINDVNARLAPSA